MNYHNPDSTPEQVDAHVHEYNYFIKQLIWTIKRYEQEYYWW